MQPVFALFFRLFLAFLAAKLLAYAFRLPGLGVLISLTLLILGNVYLFDYLDYRSRTAWRRSHTARQPQEAASVPPAPPKQTQET